MSPRPKALVLGGRTGLLGQALVRVLRESGWDALPTGRDDVNVLDSGWCACCANRAGTPCPPGATT